MRRMSFNILVSLLVSDIRRFETESIKSKFNLFMHSGWRCSVNVRLLQFFYSWRSTYIAYALALKIQKRIIRHYGTDICPGSEFGPGLKFPHPVAIVIGSRVRVGQDCTILQGVTLGERNATGGGTGEYPVIGNRVLIGANSLILGGVQVGDDARIGASSLVLKNVPPNEIIVGIYN